MRVDEVTIENFRGIRAMKMPLHPRVNLFVGINGSGKSTILDCVALLLARFIDKLQAVDGIEPRPLLRRHLTEDDITLGATAAKISLTASHEAHSAVTWTLKPEAVPEPRQRALDSLVVYVRQALAGGSGASIPIVAHYPVNRTVLQPSRHHRSKHTFEQLNALDEAMSGSTESFKLFFEWFQLREDIENEQFRKAHEEKRSDFDWQDRQLGAVRAAIPKFLDGFKDLRIRRVPAPMRMMVTKDTEELALDQLSDGEKCLLALVGDLARRLAIANPTLPDPLTGSGVVLIDEVDLHLHPGWQRMIVPTLRDTFPGCQFLLTTHSPQIISHVPPQCIRILHREEGGIGWGQPGESFGMDTNRVLSEIMGTDERPHDVKARLEALFTLIGDGDLVGAREAVAALRADHIAVEPELVKADAVIHRKELHRAVKHIHKGPEPTELTDWNLACAGAPTEWDDLPKEVNEALRKALVDEQGHICCYCGRRLLPGDYHIEHQVPRNGAMGDPALTFIYMNLLASCQANLMRKDPRHCGTAKGDWYDGALMVSPLDPGCEGRFIYDVDGKVRPADPADEGAKETIQHLDLDGARLRNLRHDVIEALLPDLDLNAEDLHKLLVAYQARDAEGRFKPFCFVLAATLRDLYGDV